MSRFTLCVAAAISLATSGAALAAPDGYTDCAKAQAPDEKTICADTSLLQEDARMVTIFKIATGFVGMGTRGDMQDAQVKWLETRHACKTDTACLQAAYTTRIGQLQKVIDAVKARGPF